MAGVSYLNLSASCQPKMLKFHFGKLSPHSRKYISHDALPCFIWAVADLLRGDYIQSGYGQIRRRVRALSSERKEMMMRTSPRDLHVRQISVTFSWRVWLTFIYLWPYLRSV